MDVYAVGFDITGAIFPPAGAYSSLGWLMSVILRTMASLTVALSLIFIIVSGIKFITASGDEKSLASAKATLTYAIVGLIALLLVFLVLQVVQFVLKSDVPISG